MTVNSGNTLQMEMMRQATIEGWALSRGGDEVTLSAFHGGVHCVFVHPTGVIPRNRESWYWQSKNILSSASQFHHDKPHFLSVYDVTPQTHQELLANNYSVVGRNLHMFRSPTAGEFSATCKVKCVTSQRKADWFNRQEGEIAVRPDLLRNPQVYDFYTEQDGLLTSRARAIHRGDYMVIDRVHTRENFERQGLASSLIAEIARLARKVNAFALTLIASEAGIPLYQHHHYLSGDSLTLYQSAGPWKYNLANDR